MSTRLEPALLGDAAPTLLDGAAGRRVVGGLMLLVLLILIGSALWVSQRALNAFDEQLLPEFDRDAEIIAERLASDLERAARLGIAVADLDGVASFLEGYLGEHPALVYLGIGAGDGRLLAAVGPAAEELAALPDPAMLLGAARRTVTLNEGEVRRTSIHVGGAVESYAVVHVGMDRSYAERQIADIRWDIAVVLIVSLLVTFELLVFVIDRTMTTPLKLIDQTIARATRGEWATGGKMRRSLDEVDRLMGAVEDTGRRIRDRLDVIDAKLARLQTVPAELAVRVDQARRRLRPGVAAEVDQPVESRANARFTLFLFVFAEELSRSFLPLYAQSIFRPIDELGGFGAFLDRIGLAVLLTPEVAIGLPIIVFMAIIALATPFGAGLVARFGSRTVFLMGAVPAIIGYLGTAAAVNVFDMLVWRSLSAAGYAFITIACQGYLAELAEGDAKARARNMAVFIAAVTTAVICGSAIGAVFADRLGFRVTFLISAGFVAVAALLAARYLQDPQIRRRRAAPPSMASQFRAFGNPRFVFLVVLAAIPAKIALTGFLFYSTPIYLASLDVSQPTIGRMIMLYGLLMLVGTQLGAKLHSRLAGGIVLIGLGGMLSGAALHLPGLLAPELGMALAIGLFGLAQGLAAAPMLAVLPDLCPDESRRHGATGLAALLRLAERVGSVIGPLLAAALVLRLGHADAIAAIGLLSAATALAFLLLMLLSATGGKLQMFRRV
jgi:predicted MFS family arabinose efflux permease